jgi:SpoVK/Ycf46/Vps4 family AAA+-type ATPase
MDLSTEEFMSSLDKIPVKSKTPVSHDAIAKFVDALRETLRDDKRESNCFRFLLENQPLDTQVEKAKGYLGKPTGVVTLLAIMQVIRKWYTLHETWESSWDDMEHATELEISVAFEQYDSVFENGYIELTNKKTNNRLMLHINTETQSPYYKVYSIEGSGESAQLVKRIKKQEKDNNLYKNKSFTLESVYGVGLLPKFIKTPKVNAEQVIIKDEIAEIIQSNVLDVFLKKKEYEENQIPTKRGILLEGAPGNGKSSLVKYINSTLEGKVTFIYVTDGVIRSATDITEIFALARAYQPCVLVFEDIDTIGLSRSMPSGGNNFTSELLAQLDGLESLENFVIIATTNHAELIDNALKNRPARFDRRIRIELPNAELRKAMFKSFLKEKRVKLTEEEINDLSGKITNKFSGALIKEAIITAKMYALKNKETTSYEHIKQSIKFIKEQYFDNDEISSSIESVGFRAHSDRQK